MKLPKIKKCECGKRPEFTNVVYPRLECPNCGNYVNVYLMSARETILEWNRQEREFDKLKKKGEAKMNKEERLRYKYGRYVQRMGRKRKQPKSYAHWLERRRRKAEEREASEQPSPERTVQDFVEEMISDGRSLAEIKAVATHTRLWASKTDEIMERAKELLKNVKKSFSELLEKGDNIIVDGKQVKFEYFGKDKEMKNLILRRKVVNNLFKRLGFPTVEKWSDVRLQDKILKLPKLLKDETTKVKKLKPKKKTLLKLILRTLKKKGKVLIKEAVDAKEASVAADEKLTSKKKKKAPKKKEKIKAAKKKPAKAKKPGEKSTKQKVYELFVKVKPKNAPKFAKKWYKETGKKVQLSTIKIWISLWKKGKGLPKGAKKK